MLSEQQQRIMGYFIEEAKDHLNTIEQGLLNLQGTIEDPEMVSEVFRAAHSVKGGAAMLGLNSIQQTAHRLEDYFKVLKECPVQVDQKLENYFFTIFDALKELLEQLQGPFGLTDDKAAEVMAAAEPTFREIGEHLSFLVDQSGGVPPEEVQLQPIATAKPATPPPLQRKETEEVSALQLLFQSDVPTRLRDMLQLFKQQETAATRQQLEELCRSLGRAGEQFDLSLWCNLCETARQAIACTDNDYRTLAPIVIKAVKQAQDLVLANRANEIVISSTLLSLVPIVEEVPEPALDFDELLAAMGDDSDEAVDLIEFDIAADESFNDALALTDTDDFLEFDPAVDLSESASLGSDDGSSALASDIDLGFDELHLDDLSGSSPWDEDAANEPQLDQQGPEVGIAELNSLADLFEGEVPDLGMTWQEEEVIAPSQPTDADEFTAGSDFADLLFDHDEALEDLSLEEDASPDLSGLLRNGDAAMFDNDISMQELSIQEISAANQSLMPDESLEELLNTVDEPLDEELRFDDLDLDMASPDMASGFNPPPDTDPATDPFDFSDLGESSDELGRELESLGLDANSLDDPFSMASPDEANDWATESLDLDSREFDLNQFDLAGDREDTSSLEANSTEESLFGEESLFDDLNESANPLLDELSFDDEFSSSNLSAADANELPLDLLDDFAIASDSSDSLELSDFMAEPDLGDRSEESVFNFNLEADAEDNLPEVSSNDALFNGLDAFDEAAAPPADDAFFDFELLSETNTAETENATSDDAFFAAFGEPEVTSEAGSFEPFSEADELADDAALFASLNDANADGSLFDLDSEAASDSAFFDALGEFSSEAPEVTPLESLDNLSEAALFGSFEDEDSFGTALPPVEDSQAESSLFGSLGDESSDAALLSSLDEEPTPDLSLLDILDDPEDTGEANLLNLSEDESETEADFFGSFDLLENPEDSSDSSPFETLNTDENLDEAALFGSFDSLEVEAESESALFGSFDNPEVEAEAALFDSFDSPEVEAESESALFGSLDSLEVEAESESALFGSFDSPEVELESESALFGSFDNPEIEPESESVLFDSFDNPEVEAEAALFGSFDSPEVEAESEATLFGSFDTLEAEVESEAALFGSLDSPEVEAESESALFGSFDEMEGISEAALLEDSFSEDEDSTDDAFFAALGEDELFGELTDEAGGEPALFEMLTDDEPPSDDSAAILAQDESDVSVDLWGNETANESDFSDMFGDTTELSDLSVLPVEPETEVVESEAIATADADLNGLLDTIDNPDDGFTDIDAVLEDTPTESNLFGDINDPFGGINDPFDVDALFDTEDADDSVLDGADELAIAADTDLSNLFDDSSDDDLSTDSSDLGLLNLLDEADSAIATDEFDNASLGEFFDTPSDLDTPSEVSDLGGLFEDESASITSDQATDDLGGLFDEPSESGTAMAPELGGLFDDEPFDLSTGDRSDLGGLFEEELPTTSAVELSGTEEQSDWLNFEGESEDTNSGFDSSLDSLDLGEFAFPNSDDTNLTDTTNDGDLSAMLDATDSQPSAGDSDLLDLEALLNDEPATAAPAQPDEELDAFGDLESLLNSDSGIPVSAPFDAATDTSDDDFANLEALLEDVPVSGTAPQPATPSELDEFDDLEKLLEDADQTLGGTPTTRAVRRPPLANNRRSPRRGPSNLNDQTMRVSVKNLDNLNNLVGELVVNRNSLEQAEERLRQFLDNLLYQVQQLSDVGQRMRDLYERSLLESSLLSSRKTHHPPSPMSASAPASAQAHATGVSFDALEMDRFTGFHTLSQEMIELIVRVRESASDIDFVVDETDQITRNFRQITTQLQEGLTRSRMVPFAQTADRLPRAVRDISMKCGKQAELVVEGRETLIDKMILEQLYDPMTHLVNNAITHGIETPDERTASGKPAMGRITVRTFHQGNQTVIAVTDDGAGIDPEFVKRKAVNRGLVTPAQAAEMSRLDVYDLLFHHGFSTRDKADDFAGRGVGMDVVRTSLNEIRGVVNIDSTIGQGTTFTIRLPLTLSISKALCCISNRARIAFPMDGVEDMLDVPKERIIRDDQGRPCIQWRDTLLPFSPLSELLKYNRSLGRGSVYGGNQEEDIVSVVVLRSAGNYLALQVDQVLGEQEIVIKQLEGPVPKPIGVAGATVLGDGRIMPIADVLELIDLSMGRIRRDASGSLWEKADDVPPEVVEVKTEPTVLIVDDSITVRELLSMTFSKIGYRVEQARDGQEAWEKLRSGLPCDLVFCDIEMPRMDGLELLSRIQKDPSLNHLPIAMLTSRGADRHRQMAIQLGAKGYFTKPYLEEALLDAAQRMLRGEVLVS